MEKFLNVFDSRSENFFSGLSEVKGQIINKTKIIL